LAKETADAPNIKAIANINDIFFIFRLLLILAMRHFARLWVTKASDEQYYFLPRRSASLAAATARWVRQLQ
jgi:hypothetical protein